MIIIKNLCKSFNGMEAVKDVSLTIETNEVIAIVGPSGGGKSSFLRCLNDMEKPDSGTIEIDGKSVINNKLKARKTIGMVFQHFNLFPHMTVLENIIYAPIKVLGMTKKDAEERAMTLLKKVHMQQYKASYPANLSGGQKQRIAIVRALAMEPKILLFDEPTSALDPEMVKEVLAVIKSLVHTGITILIVTHLMSFAKEIADRIVFFADGKIIEIAKPKQFFSKPKTHRAREFLDKIL